jgi:hypothetical protein
MSNPPNVADVLLTCEQFRYHLGRAGADWNFDAFCRAQGWTTTSLHDGDSMYLYAIEKFHKFQDVAHFLNNNGSYLLSRIILTHMAEVARRDQ